MGEEECGDQATETYCFHSYAESVRHPETAKPIFLHSETQGFCLFYVSHNWHRARFLQGLYVIFAVRYPTPVLPIDKELNYDKK